MNKLLMAALLALVYVQPVSAICPTAPTPTSPGDGAQVPFGSVVLNWNGNGTSYDVYVGLDGDSLSLHDTTTVTQTTIQVEPGRTVEWKVVAKVPTCPDIPSVHFTFTTKCPTVVPLLQDPDPGEAFAPGEAINFNWTAMAGATSYDVRVTPDFGQTFATIASDITTTSFTTDDLLEGDWGWHVRVNFNGNCGPFFSQPSHFLVTGCATATAPDLVSPAGNATVTQPFTFHWTNVGADEYNVFVQQANGSPRRIGSTTTNSLIVDDDLDAGTYAWWVVARRDDCPDMSSSRRVINVQGDGGCPANPGKATLVAPAVNATNLSSPVTFDWSEVPSATGYRVLASFGNGEAESLGSTTDTKLTVKLPAGSGAWLVQTFFGEGCPSTLSERRAFTVTQGASCSTTGPQLLSPPNGQQTVASPVLFDWTAVPDAIGYALFVSTGDDDDDFSIYGTTDAATTQLQRLVPNGEVRWFVVARFSGCPDVRSSVFTFGDDSECLLGAVQILTPAAAAEVTSPVTVSWTAVPNAAQYRVTLKTENGAIALSSRTTNTSASLPLPSGTFIVQVEALGQDCESSSAERRFTVREGANCATNAAPVPVSPVGPESQPAPAQSPVTLTWSAVANAIGYRVWVGGDEDEPFEDVALTTQTSDEIELEPGRYRWFVQALFEGCGPTRSAIAYFVIPDTEGCTREAPQVVAPANGATVNSPVTIDWSPVAGAEKYRVLALVDDKLTLLGTTEDTQLTRTLFPGDYIFVVQAELEECASTESARTRFTVRRAQSCPSAGAQLVSPANGATNVAADVEFVWAPVSGAIEYAVVARVNDGAETLLGKTDGTQLRRRMPPGKITWTVLAVLPGCDPLRAQPFTFSVPRPQNCSERKPVLLFPTSEHGDVPSPVEFAWLGVPNAIEYRIWVAQGSPAMVATTTAQSARVTLAPGSYRWFVEARFAGNCPSTFSAEASIVIAAPVPCGTPARPEANVIGQALSGVAYQLRWTPLANVSTYEVQESTSLDFQTAASFTSPRPSMKFTHGVTGAPVQYLYRVRGVSGCNDSRGPYSGVVGVFVIDPKTNNASTELGTDTPIVQTVLLPGGTAPQQFTVKTDQPWLTVTPSSGTLPVEGLTLTVTADPDNLGAGTNTATLQVTYGGGAAKGVGGNDSTTISLPLSVSLVTPVTPSGKGTPPPDALIFAAVGHAAGVNDSLFESDIRLTNLTAQTMKYDLNFTPSGIDGTQQGITSTIEVPPGVTMALDDVVASAFGSGTIGSSLGMLEVRPVATPESGGLFGSIDARAQQQIHTAASSRTYNFTPNGTFGQFIPATPYASFVGRNTVLSLQQVAQSFAYRANFGFLEASGQPAELAVRVYDTSNNLLATIPVSLGAMQHRQMNGFLQNNGITNLADGRVEVEVVSGEGKVSAYVSEVDNATNDPLLVSPVVKGAVRANRYIVPGMAYINTGSAFWVTDLRIFNAGTAATPATLTFYPMGNPAGAMTRDVVLDAGEIEVLNNVLVNTFGVTTSAGGSIVITTPSETALTATARTYNQTSGGTYGQYIPGVTVADAVGVDDRALQILQVEQSTRFRTNIGLNETTGKPATVEVSLITPDSLTTPVVTIGLQANEFRQIGLIDFGLPDAVYNGRVTVKVVGGEGRVTAYGSAIDQITQDPTYVPPQ